jgi:hypothetical protein
MGRALWEQLAPLLCEGQGENLDRFLSCLGDTVAKRKGVSRRTALSAISGAVSGAVERASGLEV